MARPIRILMAKPGLDGHDRGAKVVALALRDAGFEVIYTGLHRSVDEIVGAAVEEDVDVVGLSVLSGAHVDITRKVVSGLAAAGAGDKLVVVGGKIPEADEEVLLGLGAAGVFPTGSRFDDIAAFIRVEVGR